MAIVVLLGDAPQDRSSKRDRVATNKLGWKSIANHLSDCELAPSQRELV
jgi:hypothetical protein